MGVNVAVTDVAAITSGGPTQDITIPGFGIVKGYIIVASFGVSDGIAVDDAVISYGASDGTRQWSIGNGSDDGVGTASARTRSQTGTVIQIYNTGISFNDGQANHSAFITDGIRINWSNLPSTAVRLNVVLFGGNDLDFEVGNDTHNGDEDATSDTTLIGAFQPDVILFAGKGQSDFDGGNNTNVSTIQIGCASSSVQGIVGVRALTSIGTTQTTTYAYNDRISISHPDASETGTRYLELTSMLSDGFRTTKRLNTGTHNFGYIAMRSVTNKLFIGPIASPNGSGKQSTIDIGFKPQFALILATGETTINTVTVSGDPPGSFAVGMFDGVNENSIHTMDDDEVVTTDCESRWDRKALFMRDGAKNTVHDAGFVSFDPDGFTLNYANATTSRRWIVLAIERNRRAMVMSHRRRRV
jgi:hypothetical protein